MYLPCLQHVQKIQYPLIAEALAIFRAVYQKFQREALLVLLYENDAWSIEQEPLGRSHPRAKRDRQKLIFEST
jgi:hypothetical protein